MGKVLDLRSHPPLAEGLEKLIFQHPENPALLVKVMLPSLREKLEPLKLRLPKGARFGIYFTWDREILETTAATLRMERTPDFLQTYHGMCETTLGMGLVVGKVSGPNGKIALNMVQIAAQKSYSAAKLHVLVDQFIQKMIDNHMIAWDLEARNLVLTGVPGKEWLVIVDGLGDRAKISLRSYFHWPMRKSLEAKQRKLHQWIDENVQTP